MLLSIGNACKILGINSQTLRRWEKEGKIKCAWTEGGQRRISQEEVARIMGCSPEEVEVKPREEGGIDLKRKEKEVKALKLDLKKEKTAKALCRIRGDSVKKARDELEILRIEQAKESLLAEKRREEVERKSKEKRERWVQAWVTFAYKCLDPIPYIFPNLMIEPEQIPLELEVRTKKAVKDFLRDIEPGEDIDFLKLEIEKIAEAIKEDYFKPYWKSKLVEEAISYIDKSWPMWLDKDIAYALTRKFREILKQNLTGLEDYEDVEKMIEGLRKEVLSALKDIEPSKRMIIIDRLFGSSAMINFDRV
jgi:excisionase family DNA binding protein